MVKRSGKFQPKNSLNSPKIEIKFFFSSASITQFQKLYYYAALGYGKYMYTVKKFIQPILYLLTS